MNRVLGEPQKVRPGTRLHIAKVAAEIGFYGTETLRRSVDGDRKPLRLSLVFQHPDRCLCEQVAGGFAVARDEAAHLRETRLKVEHLSGMTPEAFEAALRDVTSEVDALIVFAPEHPIVSDAILRVSQRGIPVYSLITPFAVPTLAGYVGLDGRRVARTAAWALHRLCGRSTKIGIFMTTLRCPGQGVIEAAFRSYFSEREPASTLLEPLITFESDDIAFELTERLLKEHPDVRGLYILGNGIRGIRAALRDSRRSDEMAIVANWLTDAARSALLDGTFDLVISPRFEDLGRRVIHMILSDLNGRPKEECTTHCVGFDLFTPESV